MRRCANCGEENSDRARFCQVCGQALDAAEPAATREVRKVVTVLFTDVTGSTPLGERLDPESLRRVMGRFFQAMQAEIERHGGVVEKFIGDAVMAVFGIPRLHEDDPLRAVKAATAMASALDRLNDELEQDLGVTLAIRTGINTGEVVAGDPSAGQQLVTGDTVNTAARLEQAAQPGEILLGEPTYRLVRDAVTVDGVDRLQLKGKAEPIPAYRLLSVQAGADAHARRLDSPMVGRDRELRVLEEALDRALSERTCHLFTLLGPAGVGKSRLVLEFLERVSATATVLRGRCLSYGEGITFFPVGEAVREAAGIADRDSQEEALAKLEAAMGPADNAGVVVAGVAELIGLSSGAVAAADASWAVRTFFEALARDRPLVILFDDIHWAEPAFLDLVEHIADWTRDAPILLLCVARPELLDLRSTWAGGKMNATSILLEPLGEAQCAELIDNLVGTGGMAAAARSRILEAAEGNPLFVEEMLGMLIDEGLLRSEEGRWVAGDEVARVAVPPTIQLLLAARLDRLDAEERAVAERASVEGNVFHRGAVTRLSPDQDRPQIRTRLLALTRKELIRPDRAQFAGEDAFRFRHLLIRDAAYQGMAKEARAELHLRFTDWLAEQAGDRLPEYEDILGYHLEQAYRYRADLGPIDDEGRRLAQQAAQALASGGRRAISRDDYHAGAGLLRRAIELTAKDGPERRELRLELVEALEEMGELAATKEDCEQLEQDARDAGDRRIEARAAAVLAYLSTSLDPTVTLQSARDRAMTAMGALRELGDATGAMRASRTVSYMTFVLGQVDEALLMSRQRMEEATRLGNEREVRRSAPGMCGEMYNGTTPVPQAIEGILATLDVVAGSQIATAHVGGYLPPLYAMQGRFDEAHRAAEDNLALLIEIGHRLGVATRLFWIGPMRVLAGELEAAETEYRESIAMLEAMDDKGFVVSIAVDFAEVLALQGKDEEAERYAEYGRTQAISDDVYPQAGWRAAKARVLMNRGEMDEAERLAREAVALIERTDFMNLEADSRMRLAEVLRARGRDQEAADEVRRALGLYERKGNVVMAARARAMLDGS